MKGWGKVVIYVKVWGKVVMYVKYGPKCNLHETCRPKCNSSKCVKFLKDTLAFGIGHKS